MITASLRFLQRIQRSAHRRRASRRRVRTRPRTGRGREWYDMGSKAILVTDPVARLYYNEFRNENGALAVT